MSYSIVKGAKGTRYLKDGKFIAKAKIPEGVIQSLESGANGERLCLFCGKETKLYRILDSQPVYLCEEDYQNRNLGQVAQRKRELSAQA